MQVIVTAVGPDNRGLADPIVHHVSSAGANIAEIQMYDHDEECLFAMLIRIELSPDELAGLRSAMREIGDAKKLSIRLFASNTLRAKSTNAFPSGVGDTAWVSRARR